MLLLHDPDPSLDTKSKVTGVPIIGPAIGYYRQVENERRLVRQAIDRGPVPEAEWERCHYSKDIRKKIEGIIIAYAFPKGSTFHPEDPIELMMVLRYGDLNECEIIMDIESAFGFKFTDELCRKLVEEKTTFIEFIHFVEGVSRERGAT
ncbi:MAG: hypothetical protein AAB263_09255 [Planctomycetota bacterium]